MDDEITDDELVNEIQKAVDNMQFQVNRAAERDIVVTIDQASQDVNNGITKPIFYFRGAVKRLLQPRILRL